MPFLDVLLQLDKIQNLYLFDTETKNIYRPFFLMKYEKDFDAIAKTRGGHFEIEPATNNIIFRSENCSEVVLAAMILHLADNT